ncbi:hypothetical protein Cantr_05323 [Candida viswanathii]|uniref:COP9 signalosome complex subunit 7 n=1 Tax=Candida viswanathii TaxID=5486 RepID=A0A367XTF1_9ASCO|nr:hypothetical protein Cantr_05323 [Candida viswanathii]
MTISIQDIPNILLDPSKISYLQELLFLSSQDAPTDEQDIKLLNTLELFTFGDYDDYVKYKDSYVELDETLLVKLIRLTIISINTDYINQVISFDKVRQEYGINVREVYLIIIELGFQNFVNVQIDDVHNVLVIREKKVLRDVYNDEEYSLRVLNEEEDLGDTRLVRLSKLKLQAWIHEKLTPVKNDFESRIVPPPPPSAATTGSTSRSSNSQDYRAENTRKRKTPDNV